MLRSAAVLCIVTFVCVAAETQVSAAIVAFGTPWVPRYVEQRSSGSPRKGDCLALRGKAEHTSTGIKLEPWSSRRAMLEGSKSTVIASVILRASAVIAEGKQDDVSKPTHSVWMAQPGEAYERARAQLAKEADEAAKLVTDEVRGAYERDGVTVVRGAVSTEWLKTLRDGCEIAQDEAGPYSEYLQKATDGGIFFTDLELARRLPLFAAFSLHGPCAAVAGAVMGSSQVRYLYDQLFIKEQGVTAQTPWHQDGGYWRVTGPRICSVFVPLDSVQAEESLAFVLGSQLWSLHKPQHFADGTPYTGTSLPEMPDIDRMLQSGKAKLKTFDLNPGDVLVFSAHTAHGGPGNWGRALSTRWTGDATTFWARPGEGAVPTGDIGLADGELLAHNPIAFPMAWQRRV